MNTHVCTIAECGWNCWRDPPWGEPTRDIRISTDAGTVDAEGPCTCGYHDEAERPATE